MVTLEKPSKQTCKYLTYLFLLLISSNLSLFANSSISLQEAVENNSVLIQLTDEWGTQDATPYFDSHGVMTVDYVVPETSILGRQSSLDIGLMTDQPILIGKQGIILRINFILSTSAYIPKIVHAKNSVPTNSVLGVNASIVIKQTSNLDYQWDIIAQADPTVKYIDNGLLCKMDYIIEVGSIGKIDENTPLLNTSPSTSMLYAYNQSYQQVSLHIPHYERGRFMKQVTVYNQNGQLLYTSSIHTNALVIDFQELGFGMGIYILEVVLDNGNFWRGLVGVV